MIFHFFIYNKALDFYWDNYLSQYFAPRVIYLNHLCYLP